MTASEWSLPLRRRADQLIREGRFDEAGRLLMQVRRVLQEEPAQGGRYVTDSDPREPARPADPSGSLFIRP